METSVFHWRKRSADLRNRAADVQDVVERSRLLSLAEGWDMMVNGGMRILELGGERPELQDCCPMQTAAE